MLDWDSKKVLFSKHLLEFFEWIKPDWQSFQMGIDNWIMNMDGWETDKNDWTGMERFFQNKRDFRVRIQVCIDCSFYTVIKKYGPLLFGARLIRLERTNYLGTYGLSSFEKGLRLDFLLYAFELADKMSGQYEILNIDEMNPLY